MFVVGLAPNMGALVVWFPFKLFAGSLLNALVPKVLFVSVPNELEGGAPKALELGANWPAAGAPPIDMWPELGTNKDAISE